MDGRIYVGDHQTLLHTEYVSPGPHGFREEDFERLFSYIVLYKHMTTSWGVANLDPGA